MNILVIEGSTDTSMVAVKTVNGSFLRYTRGKGSHSKDLFVNIEAVLSEAGITIQDIDCIGVGVGPGSFTGIRIAVSSARMLAQVTGKALVGVSSPRLYAESVLSAEGDLILVAFDAKKGRVFAEVFGRNNDGLAVLLPAGDYFPEEIVPVLKESGRIITVGDGSEKYRENFTIGNSCVIESFVPDGEKTCNYIEKEYIKDSEAHADFRIVLPCYARKSDAEVLREKTGA